MKDKGIGNTAIIVLIIVVVAVGSGYYLMSEGIIGGEEYKEPEAEENLITENVYDLTVSPPKATCIDNFEISGVVKDEMENVKVEAILSVDNEVIKSHELISDENGKISFSVENLDPGEYTVKIESASKTFVVEHLKGVWTGFQTYTLRGIKKGLPSLWEKYFQGWEEFIKGPTNMMSWQKLGEMGVNTIAFGPFIWIENNEIVPIPENARKEIIQNIQTAHEKGFNVTLCNPVEYKRTRIVPEFDNVVLKWAEIAENHNVEMYAPGNHLSLASWNSLKELSNWAQQILPKIKNRYSGKVIWKGTFPSAMKKINLSGYDYVAFFNNYPRGKENLKSYEKRLESLIDNMIETSEEDNVEPIIGEFGIVPRRSSEELSQACEITFKKSENLDGLFFMTQPLPFASENARIVPPKGVRPTIKEWFENKWINQVR